jgi:pectate lyase-like protein
MPTYTRTSDLASSPTTQAPYFNVQNWGARGDGVTNDAEAINYAYAALLAGGGGVLYFPAGSYIYTGVGIDHNPSVANCPMYIKGDGIGATQLTFGAISGAQGIRVSSQVAMATGNAGGGLSGMTIVMTTAKDAVVINNLELFRVHDLHVLNGVNAFTVTNSRLGSITDCHFSQWSGNGILFTGETYGSDFFRNIQLVGAGGSSWGFNYSKTTSADAGGVYLENVICNTAGQGGFLFTYSGGGAPLALFGFMANCVVDGPFGNHGWSFVNVTDFIINGGWSAVSGSTSAAFCFDNSRNITISGGIASAQGGGADFLFKNTCDNIQIHGSQSRGTTTGYQADSTTHTNIVIDNSKTYCPTVTVNEFNLLSPRHARVLVYNNANISTTDVTFTSVTFNTEVYDGAAMHSTGASTELFVAPANGVYRYQCAVTFAANGTGVRRLRALKNGTIPLAIQTAPGFAAAATGLVVSGEVYLNKDDFVSFHGWQNSGGALNMLASTASDYTGLSASVSAVKTW